MNNGVLIFGIGLTSLMAFVAGVGYGEKREEDRASKSDNWNITKTGSMNIGNAVVGVWLKPDGKVVVFKQPSNGDGAIWILQSGPIELGNGNGTSIVVNKISK